MILVNILRGHYQANVWEWSLFNHINEAVVSVMGGNVQNDHDLL